MNCLACYHDEGILPTFPHSIFFQIGTLVSLLAVFRLRCNHCGSLRIRSLTLKFTTPQLGFLVSVATSWKFSEVGTPSIKKGLVFHQDQTVFILQQRVCLHWFCTFCIHWVCRSTFWRSFLLGKWSLFSFPKHI